MSKSQSAAPLSRVTRRPWGVGLLVVLALGGVWLAGRARAGGDDESADALLRYVRSPETAATVRSACSSCHVFPEPDILPAEYWITAVRGMYQIAANRGVELPLRPEQALAWYLHHAQEELPPAPGRTDAGPGSLEWDVHAWRPAAARPASEQKPGVTHVEIAPLLGGSGSDIVVSDVSTNRVYALRPHAPESGAVEVGAVRNPGRLSVADLDGDGREDVIVAELGDLVPTNDPVGSVVWFRATPSGVFEAVRIADDLGRVGDVHATDVDSDGRTDVVVAVFGWMEGGRLLILENTGDVDGVPTFTQHVLDERPGFTDARAVDLDGDGRKDIVALIAQEYQQVMVYWAEDDGYRAEVAFQAPNPDWGFTGMEVVDFTGNGLPDVIVANGDNLDLTFAKPYHGVGMLENLGAGKLEYRHLTSMYGVHRAVPVDLDSDGLLDLVLSAWLPPSVVPMVPEPREAVVWLQRVGPTRLVRRVLQRDGVHHMTLDAGDVTGNGVPEIVLGWIDLGVVDPGQANPGVPLEPFVTWWRSRAVSEAGRSAGSAGEGVDWSPDARHGETADTPR